MTSIASTGSQYVPRSHLDLVQIPAATDSFRPVPHGLFTDKITTMIENAGYEITKTDLILAKQGQQLFGTMYLARPETAHLGYGAAVGFRSSYDKTLSLGLTVGSSVFVCSNLAFSGDITLFRRHTTNVMTDLDYKLFNAINQLGTYFKRDDKRYAAYRATTLDQRDADHLIAGFLRNNVIGSTDVGTLLREWYEPSHAEHTEGGNTVWRLLNAATETLKSNSALGLRTLPFKTQRLQTMLDDFIDVDFEDSPQQALALAA